MGGERLDQLFARLFGARPPVKLLGITAGHSVKLDDADYAKAKAHVWRLEIVASGEPVVQARAASKIIVLRRFITDAPKGSRVSHLDGDPLNNCKSNLLISVKACALKHLKLSKHKTLGMVGVVWNDSEGVWQIVQTRLGVTTYRGRFYHRDEALDKLAKAIAPHDLL